MKNEFDEYLEALSKIDEDGVGERPSDEELAKLEKIYSEELLEKD
jgi:hypothetical protein